MTQEEILDYNKRCAEFLYPNELELEAEKANGYRLTPRVITE